MPPPLPPQEQLFSLLAPENLRNVTLLSLPLEVVVRDAREVSSQWHAYDCPSPEAYAACITQKPAALGDPRTPVTGLGPGGTQKYVSIKPCIMRGKSRRLTVSS